MKAVINDSKALRSLCLILKKNRDRSGILSKALIRTSECGEYLECVATDLDVTKILRIPAECEEQGSLVVDIMALDKMAKNLKKVDGSITIRSEDDTQWARLEHPKITTRLAGTHPDEFPNFVEEVDTEIGEMDGDRMRRVLESCEPAISSDDARANLTGLYLEGDRAISTDGHRLRKMQVDGADFGPGAIVPKSAIGLAIYAAKKVKPETIYYAIGEDHAAFQIGLHTITARLIDGTFPDYTQVLPKENGTQAKIDKGSALQALDLLEPTISSKTNNVRATVADDRLELYASDPDNGEATAPVVTHFVDGANVKAGFNADYLEDALSDMPDDEITISIIDTLSPTTITCESEPDCFWVVMPMRL